MAEQPYRPEQEGNGQAEVEISVRDLTKTFGAQTVFEDVTCDVPKKRITVILGPSGTGKSVFLKHLVGLLKPDRGEIWIDGKDLPTLSDKELYKVRRKFGVLFQDGALFGSMSVYDNVAFPLREHTRKGEREIRDIVGDKLGMVGLQGAEDKLPGQISGGMKKRAGLARALVLDPEIVLFDEPDSGLDPVRTAFLCELIRDLNRQLDATFMVVTHDIAATRRVADHIGMLCRRKLVQFGTAKQMFESDIPEVRQFLAGDTQGPIGMAEEEDEEIVSTSGMTAEETEERERAAAAARDEGTDTGGRDEAGRQETPPSPHPTAQDAPAPTTTSRPKKAAGAEGDEENGEGESWLFK
jgi:phospholipid/cholesterol/gamma-HCH transport system ATP-binding protein